MAMPRKLLFRRPPDGLHEISDRVYVFNCCFNTGCDWSEEQYRVYVNGIVGQFRENVPNASIMVCNFREEDTKSKLANILFEHDITLMNYPCHYHDCPVLKMEAIRYFLRSCESWLSEGPNKVLLMHCEHGGWPVLAFMLAALLISLKRYEGEQRTLDMVYRQAPRELLQFFMPVNPIPSQLRYLQYVSSRNVALDWPLLDRALRLDCIILRFIPDFDWKGGCRPMFRIYGHDPFIADQNPVVLYSMPKRARSVRAYKQGESEQIKIDINCHIQGDVLIESINLNGDMEREQMMFRAMFNTNFIRPNMLILNRDKIDVLWDAKDHFPNDFRIEILFSEMDAGTAVLENGSSCFEEKEGLPVEAFSKVQEIFSYADWMNTRDNVLAPNVLQKRHASTVVDNMLDTNSDQYVQNNGTHQHQTGTKKSQEEKNEASCFLSSNLEIHSESSTKQFPENDTNKKEDKTIKVDATSPKLNRSDIICQGKPNTSERTSERSNYITDSKNLKIKLPSSASVDKSSSSSISPQTPPLQPRLTRSAKKVRDSPPNMESSPHNPFPSKSRHHATGRSESLSQDTDQSFSSRSGSPFSHSSHNMSSTDVASRPLASAITSTQPPPPVSSLSSPTPRSPKILPVRSRTNSSPSHPKTPASPLTPPLKERKPIRAGPSPSPLTPPPKGETHVRAGPPPSPPALPPSNSGKSTSPTISQPPPPPPPAAELYSNHSNSSLNKSPAVPSAPAAPPPPNVDNGFPSSLHVSGIEGHRSGSKGRNISHTMSSNNHTKKLKPLHWLKLSRAVQGSLWAEAQKSGEASKAPEIDMSELESLFSAAVPSSGPAKKSNIQSSAAPKSDKVQLIDHTRAYNCEIVLSKVKVPLQDLLSSVLALEESALDTDQVENLIKFCPTKEEKDVLKGYDGEKEKLGRCEQFFQELMKVPRVESKLGIYSFKIQFHSQASDLRNNLNVVNAAAEEIRNSVKLKRIMQTILSLGNALNQGTAKGSAIGFRLDTLLKLTETRARNKKITLMHYLCKVLADKLPEVLDFSNDLANLDPATKIQLKFVAEEMQAINKGLKKVEHELLTSENDGPISETFCKNLKEFLCSAEAEVYSLTSLYSIVGRNVDALVIYFGEDPSRCPFEQVVTTLLNFTGMFNKAHEENCKELELEMKTTEENEKKKCESERLLPTAIRTNNVN